MPSKNSERDMSKPVAIFARFCSVTLRRPDSMEARYVRSMPILRAKRSWLEPFLARSSLILSPTCIWRRFCIPEDYFDVVYITTDYIQHFKLIETDESGCFYLALCQTKHDRSLADRCLDAKRPFVLRLMWYLYNINCMGNQSVSCAFPNRHSFR